MRSFFSTMIIIAALLCNHAITFGAETSRRPETLSKVNEYLQNQGMNNLAGESLQAKAREEFYAENYALSRALFLKAVLLGKEKYEQDKSTANRTRLSSDLAWLGWSELELNRYEDARNLFKESLDIKENEGAFRGLGWAEYSLKEYDAARKALLQGLDIKKSDFAYTKLGWAEYFLENYEAAEKSFSDSLDIKENEHAYNGLGWVNLKLENYEAAKKSFSDSLAIKDNAEAFRGVGWVEYALGNYSAAIKPLQQSLEIEKKTFTYTKLGWVYYQLKDYDSARKMFDSSYGIDQNTDNTVGLGWSYYRLGEYPEARRWFEESLHLNNSGDAFIGLGATLMALGEYQEAIGHFHLSSVMPQLYEQNPGVIDGYLASSYYAVENYLKAIEYAERSFQANPTRAVTIQTLINAKFKTGQTDEISKDISTLDALKPFAGTLLDKYNRCLLNADNCAALGIDSSLIPSDLLTKYLNQVVASGEIQDFKEETQNEYLAPLLSQGVQGIDGLRPTDSGLKIIDVSPRSSAAEAGLQGGDIIITIDGIQVRLLQYNDAVKRLMFGESEHTLVLTVLKATGRVDQIHAHQGIPQLAGRNEPGRIKSSSANILQGIIPLGVESGDIKALAAESSKPSETGEVIQAENRKITNLKIGAFYTEFNRDDKSRTVSVTCSLVVSGEQPELTVIANGNVISDVSSAAYDNNSGVYKFDITSPIDETIHLYFTLKDKHNNKRSARERIRIPGDGHRFVAVLFGSDEYDVCLQSNAGSPQLYPLAEEACDKAGGVFIPDLAYRGNGEETHESVIDWNLNALANSLDKYDFDFWGADRIQKEPFFHKNPTRIDIEQHLNRLSAYLTEEKSEEKISLLIYFTGHGATVGKFNYYLPVLQKGIKEAPPFHVTRLKAIASKLPVLKTLMINDFCNSGLGKSEIAMGVMNMPLKDPRIEKLLQEKSFEMISATKGKGITTAVLGQGSTLTQAIVNYLNDRRNHAFTGKEMYLGINRPDRGFDYIPNYPAELQQFVFIRSQM